MKNKKTLGAPKKPPTITPGLRIDKDLWKYTQSKYPRQLNKMFTEWIKSL